jgi:peroxiredoxin
VSLRSLRDELQERSASGRAKRDPAITAAFDAGVDAIRAAGIAERALAVGETAPDLTLPDATGRPVALADLLARGPVVITFYRGGWCPYCSMQLRAYQAILPELEAAGATLVAISPQTPDASMSTAEQDGLAFPVLSDVGSEVARAFRLVHPVGADVRAIYDENGFDLAGRNALGAEDGAGEAVLPLPATYVLDRQGTVRFAFVAPDYVERAEPQDLLAAVRAV